MSTLQLGILGPMHASRDGVDIPLGGPQQRTVLALLVLAKGNGVSMMEFLEVLWEAKPPRSGVNTVRTYVKRLRKALDPDHRAWQISKLLSSVGDGYALATEGLEVDLWRFQALVGEARQARQLGDHSAAALRLSAALSLWRGQFAGELPRLANHPKLLPVEAERWMAVDWFAESALAIGAPEDAIALMEDAAIARPFDELAHARLIGLYHACGRRGDAVCVFQHIRRRLRDELGLSPGSELSAAFSAVLQDAKKSVGWQGQVIAPE